MKDAVVFTKQSEYNYEAKQIIYRGRSQLLDYRDGGVNCLEKMIGLGEADVCYPVGNIELKYIFTLDQVLDLNNTKWKYLKIIDDLFYGVDGNIHFQIISSIVSVNQQVVNVPYTIFQNEFQLTMSVLRPYFSQQGNNEVQISVTVNYPQPNEEPLIMRSLNAGQILGDELLELPTEVIGGGKFVEGILLFSTTAEIEGDVVKYNEPVIITVRIINRAINPKQQATLPSGSFYIDLREANLVFDHWITINEQFTIENEAITNVEPVIILPNTEMILKFMAKYRW